MKNLSKHYTAYIREAIRLPFLFFHELSHWIFVVFFYLLAYNDFPRLRVVRWFTVDELTVFPTHACIEYYSNEDYTFISAICAAAPGITTIILFIISPWWMYPLYLSNIDTMWLSIVDRIKVEEAYYKIFKPKT